MTKYQDRGEHSQAVNNLSATQETQVPSLGQEDPLEKGMATLSRILAWRIHGQRGLPGRIFTVGATRKALLALLLLTFRVELLFFIS